MLQVVRGFFAARQVLEVQTPVLGRRTVTDPAIDSLRTVDGCFLQTSPEYHMKRLLAAGAPSIFQIGPVFRRGEEGRWHNPEFTMIEWYRRDADAAALMDETAALVDVVLGPAPCERRGYAELLRDALDVDLQAADEGSLAQAAKALGLADPVDSDAALGFLFDEALRRTSTPRLFVTRFPASQAALAQLDAHGTAERFELIVHGIEVANGYHELRDADELERRMAADAERRRKRGLPPVEPDAAFLAAHRHGLPNCAGVAVGFDRLLALKLGCADIAEALAFDWRRA